ncbi:hypothetical protein MAR_013136 [Mya arenaria]|uniref:Uncharacterized protein n=1 Tax=Mya arenaria TaxID=6604 RepID=A0ABY7G2A1_MYAAR|nr:apidaecins type 73-like [Mya arenaria]XP_052783547.1 apidaecins type 73-like [Mya arenaria]XP_052783548.1 apidaecins type 73-like [Mya arenaria]XP_052783549.1 apidaecins type 73-like [Mya arenaria]WAR27432.1 hypothetical protein MAR_013136 [Mya arenaria]
MTDSKPRPYPGYNPEGVDNSPRQVARVKPEAEGFANRGHGSLDLFARTPRYIDDPQPEPRCPGNSARRNYEVGRHGTVNALLYGQATPRADYEPAPRVKSEAEPIAEAHKGRATSALLNSYGHLPTDDPSVPRVKPEAEDTAEQHKGGRMNCLLHDPKKLPNSARPVPRVKTEAAMTADQGKGGQMNKTMHSYGSSSSRQTYAPRVKPEASENAEKGKGYMGTLFGKYGKLPTDVQPVPKVRGEGGENMNLDQGGRMSRLMYEGSRLPQDPKPPPRANTKSAKNILKASRGQMAQIFAEQGKRQTVAKAGVRSSSALGVY